MTGETTVKGSARTWEKNAKELGLESRKRPVIVYYDSLDTNASKPPGFKESEDTVYIIGHCHKEGSDLCSSQASVRFDRADLNIETVVIILDSYFPSYTIKFKLLACFGGAHNINENTQTGLMNHDDSFAQKLYSRLRRRYCSAILSAYCLPVMAGLDAKGHKRLATGDGKSYWGRSSGKRITFDA